MDEPEWITWQQAADIVGCAPSTMYHHYVDSGVIKHRDHRARRGSLDRASVERFAAEHRRLLAERDAARRRAARPRRPGPRSLEGVWLGSGTTALMFGFSRERLHQLLRAGRIPATREGRRWWFRRDHVEQLVAARAFTELQVAYRRRREGAVEVADERAPL